MVIWPVRQLGRVLTDTGKAVVSLGRINEILNETEESREPAPEQPRARGELHFEHVDFAYEPGRPVLRDISLHVPAGQTLPASNFVLLDGKGRIWITISTRREPRSLGYRPDVDDGFIILADESGARIVALCALCRERPADPLKALAACR